MSEQLRHLAEQRRAREAERQRRAQEGLERLVELGQRKAAETAERDQTLGMAARVEAAGVVAREDEAHREKLAARDAELDERLRERPELGVAILALGPLLPFLWLIRKIWRRRERELRHDQLAFRFHDYCARNPEVGLILQLAMIFLGFLLALGAVSLVLVLGSWIQATWR